MKSTQGQNPIPQWLKGQLCPEDLTQIEEAIAKVELKTSGEVIPIVVRRSSTMDHVPTLLLLLQLLLLFSLDIPHIQSQWLGLGWWGWVIIDGVVAMSVTRLLAPLPWMERTLTSKRDQNVQVNQRAQIEYYESNINTTVGQTGVLLFVSLVEHQAVVLADKAIADLLPPETWDNVIQTLLRGIKNEGLATGLIQGIEESGKLLSAHFPRSPDDQNELPNHLIIKE